MALPARSAAYGSAEEVVVKHPMQPVVMVRGVARFQPNGVIQWLWDEGLLNLNDIAIAGALGKFSPEDQMQLAQLLGYSVSGFSDLSYADPAVVAEADAAVSSLIQAARDLPPMRCWKPEEHPGHRHINEGPNGGCGLPEWCDGYALTMSESSSEVPQAEVSVEQPAKTTDTVTVDAAPETAGPAQADAVTEGLEVEPKE